MNIPRWAAPLLGGVAGLIIWYRRFFKDDSKWWPLLFCFAIGVSAGMLVWLADAPTPEVPTRATWLGKVFAALALLAAMLPFIGVVIGAPAFFLNRRVKGWENVASRIGFGLSAFLTLVVLVTWFALVYLVKL